MQVIQGINTLVDAVMRLVSSSGELPKTADLLKVSGGKGLAEGVSGDFMSILAELSAGGDTNKIAIPVNNGGGMPVLLTEISPDVLTTEGNLPIPAKLALMGDDGEIVYLPVFVHITDGEHEIAAGNQPTTLRIERENRSTELTELTESTESTESIEFNPVSVPGFVASLPPAGTADSATVVSSEQGEPGEINILGEGARIETDHPLVFRNNTILPEQAVISAPTTPENGQKFVAGQPRVEGDKYGVTDTAGDAPPPVPQGTKVVKQAVVHNSPVVGEQNTDGVVTFKLAAMPAEQTNGVQQLVLGDSPLVHLLARYAESGNPVEIELVVPRGELFSPDSSATPEAGTHQWRLVLADVPGGTGYRDIPTDTPTGAPTDAPTGAQDSRGSTGSLLISTHREVINRLAVLSDSNTNTSHRNVNIQGQPEHEAAFENAQPLSRIGLPDAPETSPVYTKSDVPVSTGSPGTSPVLTRVGVPDGPDAPETSHVFAENKVPVGPETSETLGAFTNSEVSQSTDTPGTSPVLARAGVPDGPNTAETLSAFAKSEVPVSTDPPETSPVLTRVGVSDGPDAPEAVGTFPKSEVFMSTDPPETSPVLTRGGVPEGPDAPEGAPPQVTSYGTAAGKSASPPAGETREVLSTTVDRDLPAPAVENTGIVQETMPPESRRETIRAHNSRTFAYQARISSEGNHQGRAVTNDSPYPGQVPSERTGGEGEGPTTAPDSNAIKAPQSEKEVVMKSPVERRDVNQPVRETSGPDSPELVQRDIGGQKPFTLVATETSELLSSRGKSSVLTAGEGDVAQSLSIEPGVQGAAVQGTSESADYPGVFSVKSAAVPARPDSDMNEYEVMNTIVRHARFMSRDGRSSAVIRLEPANLGRVKLDIVTEQSRVTGRIIVESAEVKEIVQHGLKNLAETLSQNGLKVESFDVQVGHNDGTDAWAQREQLRQHAGKENIRSATSAWTRRDAGVEGTAVVPGSAPSRSIDSHMLDITV